MYKSLEEYRDIGRTKWLLKLIPPLTENEWSSGYISCTEFFFLRWGFYKKFFINEKTFYGFFVIDWSEEEKEKLKETKKRVKRRKNYALTNSIELGIQGFFFFLLDNRCVFKVATHRNTLLIRIESIATDIVFYIHGDGVNLFKKGERILFQEPHENIGKRTDFVEHIEYYCPECSPFIIPKVRPDPDGFVTDILEHHSLQRMFYKHIQLVDFLTDNSEHQNTKIRAFLGDIRMPVH